MMHKMGNVVLHSNYNENVLLYDIFLFYDKNP